MAGGWLGRTALGTLSPALTSAARPLPSRGACAQGQISMLGGWMDRILSGEDWSRVSKQRAHGSRWVGGGGWWDALVCAGGCPSSPVLMEASGVFQLGPAGQTPLHRPTCAPHAHLSAPPQHKPSTAGRSWKPSRL